MTFDQLRALANVLDYLEPERQGFAEFIEQGGDPRTHIFHHVAILERMLAEEGTK